jgi:hypothetical protein
MAGESGILKITGEHNSSGATSANLVIIVEEFFGRTELEANSQFSVIIPVVDLADAFAAIISVDSELDSVVVTIEGGDPAEVSLTLSGPLVVYISWASVGGGLGLANALCAGGRKQESNGGVLHFEIIS